MSSPYLGEIRLFPWPWAPQGWHLCDGTVLPISQYTALFSLIGTYYGGNGTTTFALPDTRGRTGVHFGLQNEYTLGEQFGTETVLLNTGEIPLHTHQMMGQNTTGGAAQPNSHSLANSAAAQPRYAPDSGALVALNPATIQPSGVGQPHDNMQPYLVLNYCIAMQGNYPPRN
jgi:microcystin-dependent protein